jgi:hypothetical protein
MAATKSQIYYERIRSQHQALFDGFKKTHDAYVADPAKYEMAFNEQGLQVMDLLRATDRQLCSGMDRGGYGAYSSKLSEKFWQLVKADYPQIDLVGIKRRVVTPTP